MKQPTGRAMRGRWRSRLFLSWVVVSLIVGLYVAIAGPFASYFSEARSFVALAVPAVMIFMLGTGLGWLALLVTSRRSGTR